MAKKEYDWNQASAKRQDGQASIQAKNELKEQKPTKKIRVNFSLSEEANKKMELTAKEMGISKSSLLQLWINEKCN